MSSLFTTDHQTLRFFSEIVGWIYLLCWAFCNLPQFILIHRRKSVAGFSITFQVLNMIGFLWYFIYLVYGFIYQHRHDTTKSIVWQDFAWCGTTLIVVYGIAIQCYVYKDTITESIHPFYQISILSIFTITFYNLMLVRMGLLEWYTTGSPENGGADAYSFMHFLGYAKTYISFVKYVPQMLLNFRRKSTHGFSIGQVILDVTGAATSFGQSVMNAYITPRDDGSPDFDTVLGNLPKLFLSLESLFFCAILLFQHYCLYRDNNHDDGDDENDPDELSGLTALSAQSSHVNPTEKNNTHRKKPSSTTKAINHTDNDRNYIDDGSEDPLLSTGDESDALDLRQVTLDMPKSSSIL